MLWTIQTENYTLWRNDSAWKYTYLFGASLRIVNRLLCLLKEMGEKSPLLKRSVDGGLLHLCTRKDSTTEPCQAEVREPGWASPRTSPKGCVFLVMSVKRNGNRTFFFLLWEATRYIESSAFSLISSHLWFPTPQVIQLKIWPQNRQKNCRRGTFLSK